MNTMGRVCVCVCRFIYRVTDRERQKEGALICWFIPQTVTTAKAGLG